MKMYIKKTGQQSVGLIDQDFLDVSASVLGKKMAHDYKAQEILSQEK